MGEGRTGKLHEWGEDRWKAPDLDWTGARFVTAGVDVGSVSSQAVIMADGAIAAFGSMRTGVHSAASARDVLDLALHALEDMPEDRIDYTVGTGYGRVNIPMADRVVTEIACHARGAGCIYGPGVRTVLDVGGQDIKAIKCDERGKVVDFIMNDKCAAGTGRGMEVFAELLGIPVQDLGGRSLEVDRDPEALSCECVVYARSEALGLLRKGWAAERVLAAYCGVTAQRIRDVLERLGTSPGFAVTGGMAKNRGVMLRLMPMVGLEIMTTGWDPQIAGAAGAALFAHTLCTKGKRSKKKRG
jgi:benzoyl-CoA reductase subunit A